jgi:3-oxoisoapionate kinase
MNGSLPRKLIAYYGDDYTGSAAVMEVMTFAGLPTVLFLDLPSLEQLARFSDCRAIGVAGIARSQTPDWMDCTLPAIYARLAEYDAPIVHYKLCSTLDSAPHVGSIGRAADLGLLALPGEWCPLVVAAPALGRYQAFGNLFASVEGKGYRLDRHPTMAHHPVTPMAEADVRQHLSRQTQRRIGLIDFVAMKERRAEAALARERAEGADIVALDVLDEETLREAGRLIWENRGSRVFALGSQGIEYALITHWQAAGLLPEPEHRFRAEPRTRIVAVSGSCSPVTARQIQHASANGFQAIALDAALAVDACAWKRELDHAAEVALAALSEGRNPLIHSACGPDDPRIAALAAAIATAGRSRQEVNDRIGSGLGQLLDGLLRRTGVRRAVIAGGDTSGHAVRQLGIDALTALAPLAPGAPLCAAHSPDGALRGLELVLKGGQGGGEDFFAIARAGGRC